MFLTCSSSQSCQGHTITLSHQQSRVVPVPVHTHVKVTPSHHHTNKAVSHLSQFSLMSRSHHHTITPTKPCLACSSSQSCQGHTFTPSHQYSRVVPVPVHTHVKVTPSHHHTNKAVSCLFQFTVVLRCMAGMTIGPYLTPDPPQIPSL